MGASYVLRKWYAQNLGQHFSRLAENGNSYKLMTANQLLPWNRQESRVNGILACSKEERKGTLTGKGHTIKEGLKRKI